MAVIPEGKLVKNAVYQHYKQGTLYEVIGMAVNTDDMSESVLYRPVGRGNDVVYHRSVKEFTEMVETPKGLVNRFKWWGI